MQYELGDIICWVGFGGGAVTALTRSHSDIARIGTIKPHTMVFELPFPAKFVVRVFFLSLDSVEC